MRLIPRDTKFFDLLADGGRNSVDAADLLIRLVNSPPPDRPGVAAQLVDVEHTGDDITHEIMRALNTSFITPFDRDDIAMLAGRLDDVVDDMEAAANLTVLYQIGDLPVDVARQADLLGKAARLTADAMPRLRTMKDMEAYWIGINDLEDEADAVYRALLAQLFNTDGDVITKIKLKEVVDQLEAAADAFEHVADVVQTIALKES